MTPRNLVVGTLARQLLFYRSMPRWLRILPWLTGLLIGATAHIVFFSQSREAPEVRVVNVAPAPAPEVHVHIHPEPAYGPPPSAFRIRNAPARKAVPRSPRPPRLERSGTVLCSAEGCAIKRSFLKRLVLEPESIGAHMRLVPLRRDGHTVGFKVFRIRRGSLGDLLGLRNGDVITALDGVPLVDPPSPREFMPWLNDADDFRLTVERRGETFSLRHRISDDA